MGGIKECNPRFVNPYNFIPLMGKCERTFPERKEGDSHTGYFECGIKLLSPLFIPNTSSATRLLKQEEMNSDKYQREQWKGYDFFSYEDLSSKESCKSWPPLPIEPVIPGSEIRGAVRSVYEAAFNGCMSSVSEGRRLSRRTNEAKKPGILKQENGQWILRPCKKAMLFVQKNSSDKTSDYMGEMVCKKKYEQWREGQEIWIKVKDFTKDINRSSVLIGEKVTNYKVVENGKRRERNDNSGGIKTDSSVGEWKQGWLHKGEAFNKKHHESVFYFDASKEKDIIVNSDDIERLENILQEYRDVKKNKKVQNENGWYNEYMVNPEGTMVYYSKVADGPVYLSPACIGKEVFTKTVGDLLENNGGYQPCSGKELCSACKVFGMMEKTEKNNTYAYGSKVRVTDARLSNLTQDIGKLFANPIILPEMGEPRPGAVEFYTKSPYDQDEKAKQGYWTYDYKLKIKHGKVTSERQSLGSGQPELRGRKYYWHSKVDLDKYRDTDSNKLNSMKQRVRPMKEQKVESEPMFHFRVYFEQLSEQQLRQLKWALDFDCAECAHKIGRAKPLGFGSAQISVDSIHLRKIDAATGKYIMERPALEEFLKTPILEDEALKTIQLMANWVEKPNDVSYQFVESMIKDGTGKPNSSASHQWFTSNKGGISQHNFQKILPEPKDEVMENQNPDTTLYKLIKKN